jgi:4-hydroxybenzoate polyprenyltransferase
MAKIKNKKYSLIERLLGLAELGRPIEWSKSLLNMFLAALIAYYCYNAFLSPTVFVVGFFAVAFLWSGLYALNDYSDRHIDKLHDRKKFRPIPSGKVSSKQGLAFSIILIILSFGIALVLDNFLLILSLLAMLANQLLYTMKPYRLKTRKVFDIISGSMINPFFRYFSGLVLFISFFELVNYPFPLFPVLFVVGIQFGGYTLYRLFSKSHDKKTKMKSTVALMSEKKVKSTAYTVLLIAILSYFGLLINGFTLQLNILGFLPPQYFLAIIIVIVVLLAIPSLRKAIIDPKHADMKSSYRILYAMNIIFVLANLIIYLVLK